MKLTSLKKKYQNQWVLAEVLEKDDQNQIKDIKPIATSKSKTTLVTKAKKTQVKHFTIIYTGEPKLKPRI